MWAESGYFVKSGENLDLDILLKGLIKHEESLRLNAMWHRVAHKAKSLFLMTCTIRKLLLVGFSACGGIRTTIAMPILTAYFPMLVRASWERVGCSWHHTTRRLPCGPKDSSTQAGTSVQIYSLSVTVWLTDRQ